MFCILDKPISVFGQKNPQIWSDVAREGIYVDKITFLFFINTFNLCNLFTEYTLNGMTDFQFVRRRTRRYPNDSIFKKVLTGNKNEYDAYEKDIALVHIYFDSSSIIEYQRQVTMTW